MIIDCNVSFGHWPFARFAEDTPARLSALLAKEGVRHALVSSADAILFPEPDECNRELFSRARRYENLHPVAVANPRIRSWRGIVERGDCRAVKVIPNYHNYSLLDEKPLALFEEVSRRGIPLLIQMRVEDERSHYELLKVKGVPVGEIAGLASRLPSLRIVALCPYFAEAVQLAAVPNVYADISFAETLDTLRQLCDKVPAGKILFGSHTPMFTARAAVMKLECATISESDRETIAFRNAAALFGIGA